MIGKGNIDRCLVAPAASSQVEVEVDGDDVVFLNTLSQLIDSPQVGELSKELHAVVQDFHKHVEKIGAKFGVGLSDNVSFQIHG